MSFKADVVDALGDGTFHQGLGALKQVDTVHVSSARPRELSGSADVDAALAATLPNAHRWDYVVGKSVGKSLHLAVAGKAQALVSGDRNLLSIAAEFEQTSACPIWRLDAFCKAYCDV